MEQKLGVKESYSDQLVLCQRKSSTHCFQKLCTRCILNCFEVVRNVETTRSSTLRPGGGVDLAERERLTLSRISASCATPGGQHGRNNSKTQLHLFSEWREFFGGVAPFPADLPYMHDIAAAVSEHPTFSHIQTWENVH